MDTYNPLFRKIIDSSVWMENLEVRVLFTTLLAVKDRDNVVRGSLFNISRWANMEEEVVMRAMEVLMSPDTRRKEKQAHEGRRVERLGDEEWLMLNGDKYQKLMQSVNQRAKWRMAKERLRARRKIRFNAGPTLGEVNHINREGANDHS